jgi:hypothetical protein
MAEPIVYVDVSEIPDGKLEDLQVAMKKLVAFVEANEPRLISYGFFLDGQRRLMTVVAIHPDSASLEFHMEIGGPEFRKFADLITLQKIEVYGSISDAALEQLHQKTRMLGGTVSVNELYAGFARH